MMALGIVNYFLPWAVVVGWWGGNGKWENWRMLADTEGGDEGGLDYTRLTPP